ncbi:MAG: hypothetical protein AAGU77_01930, partial [Bacillota bacterium]
TWINVIATGDVSADCKVHGVTVSVSYYNIVINLATAVLNAAQSAYISGASVEAGGDVTVRSLYNASKDNVTINQNKGATATVGANGGGKSFSFAVAGAQCNTAYAHSNSTSQAYILGVSTTIGGELIVDQYGTSYAKADIYTPTFSVSLVNLALTLTFAQAAGAYNAYVDSTDSASGIGAGDVTVYNLYNTRAHAEISPAGGGTSGSLSVVSGKVNLAKADTTSTAQAYIAGSGDIVSGGYISVIVSGTSTATAIARQPKINVNLVDVAANATQATLAATQNAYFNVSGTASADGAITVHSIFSVDRTANGGAIATVETPKGGSGVTVSLVSGAVSYAKSSATLNNAAYIGGGGTITAGSVDILASAITNSVATANATYAAGLVILGGLYAEATTKDTVKAYIGDATSIIATGSVTVNATGDTVAKATSDMPGSASLYSGSTGLVKASIGTGTADANRQTVEAAIGNNANITAGGNITIDAYNTGYATAVMMKGRSVSGIGVSSSILPTYGYYRTVATIGTGANVQSMAGNIVVHAKDMPRASTSLSGNSIGLLVSASNMYAKNEITQTVYAGVGSGSTLDAHGSISIKAESSAYMSAKTNANSGGIFDGGTLKAVNTLSRDTDVSIGSDVKLYADYGNIDIIAQSGLEDYIYTSATGNSAGLVTIGEAKATATVTSNTDTTVGLRADIRDTFNTVTVAAYTAEKHLETIGDFGSGALSSNPDSRAYVSSLTSNAKVHIATAASGGGEDQTNITGRYVNIFANLKDLYASAYTHAVAKGLHGTADAYSTVTAYMDIDVELNNVVVRGYDKTTILANATPTSSGTNIRAYASTKIVAFIGSISSHATSNGSINAKTAVGGKAVLMGADVSISAKAFAGSISLTATGTRKALATKSTHENYDLGKGKTVTVANGAEFHIGDAAAGIVIDIPESGSLSGIRAVGLPGESKIWTMAGGAIQINNIQNARAGRLYVECAIPSNSIYGQQYIPEVIILNHSDLDVILKNIDVFNESYTRPSVGGTVFYNTAYMGISKNTEPLIHIESRGSGDVTLNGLIANERGTVEIIWTDPANNGSLYTGSAMLGDMVASPLWAHILIVENAKHIGTAAARFSAYLAPLNGADASVDLIATGNIYAELTLAEIKAVDTLPAQADHSAITGTLLLKNIIAGGENDLLLPYAIRISYLKGASAVSVIIPGMLEYTSTKVSVPDFTLSDITRYVTGYNPADASVSYLLPNGTSVYVNEYGKVLRVVSEDGVISDLSRFCYAMNGNELILTFADNGVSINLTTGILTVPATITEIDSEGNEVQVPNPESYELFFEWQLEDGWLVFGGGSSISVYKKYSTMQAGSGDNMAECELYKWKTEGSYDYYFVYDENAYNTDFGHTYYVVKVVTATNAIADVYSCTRWSTGDLPGTLYQGSAYNYSGWSYQTSGSGDDTVYYSTRTYQKDYSLVWNNIGQSGADFTYRQVYTYTETWYYDKDWVYQSSSVSSGSLSGGYHTLTGVGLTWDNGYIRVVNGAYTGAALTAYNVMTGRLIELNWSGSEGSLTGSVKLHYIPNAGNSISPVTPEGADYQAFVFGSKGNENYRELAVYDEYHYNYSYTDGNGVTVTKDYEMDLKDFKLEFKPGSFWGFTISVGATIQVEPGDSIKILQRMYNGQMAYRLEENLWVTAGGTVYTIDNSSLIIDESNWLYSYNGITGAYRSANLDINCTGGDLNAPAFTIKGGIYLEKLSEKVAKAANGNYYYYDGSTWQIAQENGGVISYGGQQKLIITAEGDVTYYTLVEEQIKLGSDGSVVWLTTPQTLAKNNSVDTGVSYLVGYMEGSDVRIKMLDTKGSLLDDDDTGATDIRSGGEVRFYVHTSGSIGLPDNLLDIDAGRVYTLDLDGNLVIYTDTYVYVPEADGDYTFEEGTVVDGATYRVVTANGDIYGENLIVRNGGLLQLFASSTGGADGNIILTGTLLLTNSGLYADAMGDILFNVITSNNGVLTAIADGDITLDTIGADNGSELSFTAGGDIALNDISADGSGLDFTAGGDIALNDISADDSELSFTAGGDIALNDITADGSGLEFTAGGGITLDDIVATGSELTFTTVSGGVIGLLGLLGGAPDPVPGDITMDTAALTDTTLTQSAYGSILFNWINALRSAASLTADGDILFDLVTANRSSIILDAGGSILVRNDLGVNPLIQFDDGDIGNGGASDNAYLSLAAGGDIGEMDLHLYIDIPALVTLHVPNVTNYFIDALDLPPVAEPPEAVHEGTDAQGNVVQGDYLKNINWQYFYSAIEAQTPEELADWIMTSLPREDWSTELDAADIAALISAGRVFTPNSLAALLKDDAYSASAIRNLLRSDPNAAQTLANALVAAITRMETITPDPDPTDPGAPVVPYDVYTMEDQQALALLATLVGEDAMQDMAGLLSGLLTSEQILALLQKAIDASLYPADEPPYIDEPARAFTMHIGVSTGAGYVYNEGDITITQDAGDITAGYFRSERGDMTISALGGSILGIANPEKEHMLARDITLNAHNSIGSAAVPLVLEEQQNRPVIVVGVDMTYYEPVAPGEDPLTAFGTRFGEFEPGTPVEVPILMAALSALDTTGYEFHLKQVQAVDENGQPLLDKLGNAVLVWVLEVVVRYDWLRVDYPAEATRIDAAAQTGDIYIDEYTGDMGVGVITAGGDVQLRAPGSLLDVRTADQRAAGDKNVTAGGNVLLDSTNGVIGTTDDRIDLAAEGGVTARAYGVICLTDTGDMVLIVESETGRI